MYQSSSLARSSLHCTNMAISGANPLRYEKCVNIHKPKKAGTHVAVSWVFMQLSMIPWPTRKSSLSFSSIFSQSKSLFPPSVIPSRNDPPKKQTRWSCLGTICHVALWSRGWRAGWSSWVKMRLDLRVCPMRCFLIPTIASSYIYGKCQYRFVD